MSVIYSAIIERGSTEDIVIADIMRDPMYVSYTMRVSDLLTVTIRKATFSDCCR